jgi:hypothetical protein
MSEKYPDWWGCSKRVKLLQIATTYGLTLRQWCNAEDILIEKTRAFQRLLN